MGLQRDLRLAWVIKPMRQLNAVFISSTVTYAPSCGSPTAGRYSSWWPFTSLCSQSKMSTPTNLGRRVKLERLQKKWFATFTHTKIGFCVVVFFALIETDCSSCGEGENTQLDFEFEPNLWESWIELVMASSFSLRGIFVDNSPLRAPFPCCCSPS